MLQTTVILVGLVAAGGCAKQDSSAQATRLPDPFRSQLSVRIEQQEVPTAISAVHSVATRLGFEAAFDATAARRPESLQALRFQYLPTGEGEILREICLQTRYRPEIRRFDVLIDEAPAGKESDRARKVREAVVERWKVEFGENAVFARGG
jgi:hypothetical protein